MPAGIYGFPSLSHPFAGANPVSVHSLEGAGGTAGPRVEVFVNGTGSLTWVPNTLRVPSNALVVFVIGIVGYTPHNFTLDAISNDTNLSVSMTPDQVFGYFNAHPPLVRVPTLNVSGAPYVTAPIQMPPHGNFEFLCEVQGHFQQGMYGNLYVGLPAPAVPSAQFQLNLIQLDFLVIASIGVVVVIGLYATRRSRGPPPQIAGDSHGSAPAH